MRLLRRAALALLSIPLAAAAARADVTIDAGFGFDGEFVEGCATPVRVAVSSTEKTPITVHLSLAPSGDLGAQFGGEGLEQETEVYLAPGATKRLTLPVIAKARFGEEWTLTVRTDRRTLVRSGVRYEETRVFRIPLTPAATGAVGRVDPGGAVLGVIGDPGNRLGWLGAVSDEELQKGAARRSSSDGTVLVQSGGKRNVSAPAVVPISAPCTPEQWLGYEGFDAVIWLDADPASLGDQARVDAVLEWALHGGRLLVSLGPGAKIPAGSALARALPVESLGHDDLDSRDLLAALTGSRDGVRQERVPVARCGTPRGRVTKALADGRPLLVEGSHGLGTVVAVAFDPRLLRDAAAAPRAALLRLLLGPAAEAPENDEGYHARSLERLENHLRNRFVKAPPLGLLILGLALYVLAIGPVDYLVLKRRNRLRRTVVTFPLIVIGFTAAAYLASFLLFGAVGGQARVAVLDFATAPARDADVVRGLDFLGTYSPIGRTLELTPGAPRSLVAAPWLSPAGLHFSKGGGVTGRVVHAPDGRPTAFVDIRLRSFRAVQTRFSGEVPASLEADRVRRGERRMLRVVNRLGARVHDLCFVAAHESGPRYLALGDLEPGAAIEVDPGTAGQAFGGALLPDPFGDGGGLFGQGWGDDAFVPRNATEGANHDARVGIGRALLGASLAGLRGNGETRPIRNLARQGLDLSRAVRGGGALVMGWCEADPIGGLLPGDGSPKSTVVAVRRLLPAEEAE